MLAWRLLFTEARAQPTYAHMTLMRGALESALTVLWLLEPDDSALRVARGVALMRADLLERRRAEESVPSLRGLEPTGLQARRHR